MLLAVLLAISGCSDTAEAPFEPANMTVLNEELCFRPDLGFGVCAHDPLIVIAPPPPPPLDDCSTNPDPYSSGLWCECSQYSTTPFWCLSSFDDDQWPIWEATAAGEPANEPDYWPASSDPDDGICTPLGLYAESFWEDEAAGCTDEMKWFVLKANILKQCPQAAAATVMLTNAHGATYFNLTRTSPIFQTKSIFGSPRYPVAQYEGIARHPSGMTRPVKGRVWCDVGVGLMEYS